MYEKEREVGRERERERERERGSLKRTNNETAPLMAYKHPKWKWNRRSLLFECT